LSSQGTPLDPPEPLAEAQRRVALLEWLRDAPDSDRLDGADAIIWNHHPD